jgi:HAE1 family hydrophobic/amphiphilic exporter-1
VYAELEKSLSEIPETASVEQLVELERALLVRVRQADLVRTGVGMQEVAAQLSVLNEKLPVGSSLAIDDASQTVLTTLGDVSLETTTQLEVRPATATTPAVRLSDIADVEISYRFVDENTPYIGVRGEDGVAKVLPALVLYVKAADGIELGDYTAQVQGLLDAVEGPTVVTHYTNDEFNQQQVSEVVTGLVGGPLDTNSGIRHIGWVLGGIQLVFLVMLAFVSWRAALVAAAAIPLSLVFANIYLFFTGHDLNTLVLFSLVLVIGLVVDPALVILESIQRKIDLGLRGKEAALAAIDDVGMGLFLATLTNIIVFVPFGVISGFLGEIFSYIPLTVIPATIGSYVVPLFFLAWIGGLFLKPSKRHGDDEIKNLWPLAQWLIRFNTRLLRSSAWIRVGVIVFAMVVSFGVAAYLFSSGQIKVVQFASGTNADYLDLTGEFLAGVPPAERTLLRKEIVAEVMENAAVQHIFPLSDGLNYFIGLQKAHERGDYRSTEIKKDIYDGLNERVGDRLFEFSTRVDFVGPPEENFLVALALKHRDSEIRSTASQDVADTLERVCLADGAATIADACNDGERIVVKTDDGYTDQTDRVIEVILDRAKLQQYQLVIPQAPLTALVNGILRQQFHVHEDPLQTFALDGYDTAVYVDADNTIPQTVEDLRHTVVYASAQAVIPLGDIATIREVQSSSSITRVKGETVAVIKAKLVAEHNDQSTAAQVSNAVLDFYADHPDRLAALGLSTDQIEVYSEGDTASTNKSFGELFMALGFAVILTYIVLVLFFGSFTQPLVILFTVPLAFVGIFPALRFLGNAQFGFLEIIGLIILVGIVENVAIFLIDAAHQREKAGADDITAISEASGLRLRPVLLTKFTALASLAPLAVLSETYRSISIVIIFGLLTSGFTSLITTPILYVFFRGVSRRVRGLFTRHT